MSLASVQARNRTKSRSLVLLLIKAAKFAFALMLLSAASCSGSLFKVNAPSTLPPLSSTAAKADLGSISFRAAPLLTDEETQELFESNLQLVGLLPVRVEIIHNSGGEVELSKVRFHLRDATGAEWKFLSAKQAI